MSATAEEAAITKETEAEVDESSVKGKDKSIWDDSDYSSEEASFRSSSAGDFGSPRVSSPPTSGSRSSKQRATPNPLLLAFPVRSDRQSSCPEKGIRQSSDNASSGDDLNEISARSKKGI